MVEAFEVRLDFARPPDLRLPVLIRSNTFDGLVSLESRVDGIFPPRCVPSLFLAAKY